jgi:hypothetical protein
MRNTAFGAALALVITGSFLTPAAAQDHLMPSPFLGVSDASYIMPSQKFLTIYDELRGAHVLEELRDFLKPLHLPSAIKVQTSECGGALTVPYASGQPVTICYELVDQLKQIAQQIDPQDPPQQMTTVVGGFIQAALVQTAYPVFELLQIPVWGRMEDAADRLAALILVEFGEDMENVAILAAAKILMHSGTSGKVWTGSDFASTDSPDAQRDFTYLCMAAAADPINFGGWLTTQDSAGTVTHQGVIPWDRSNRCAGEYAQVRKAFDLRIMPHVDASQLVVLRAPNWLDWKPQQ